jgi:DNA-binding LacI/PurR family transcriptional regulator
MKKDPITIRDIAIKLNISVSTVSRALRGFPEISPATRKAVEEMAKQLNYQPNMIAKSLRSNKTFTLGVVIPELVSHFFSSNISGIQDMASKKGYNIIICQSNESYETEVKNLFTLVSSRVDGLLISLSRETKNYDHLESVYANGIPLVFFDRICESIETSKVTVDDYDGAIKAVEHLIQMGCKRIAHISGPKELSITKNRKKGYIDAHKRNNLSIDEDLIIHSESLDQNVEQPVNKLLDLSNPPDGLFAINDSIAIQAMIQMKSKGIKIPDDIAVVGFNNEPTTTIIEPSLTSIAQPAYEIGQISTKLILDLLNKSDDHVPQSVILKTKLIIRDSSRKIKD